MDVRNMKIEFIIAGAIWLMILYIFSWVSVGFSVEQQICYIYWALSDNNFADNELS